MENKKSLLNEFNVKEHLKTPFINDYEIFSDKDFLDEIRKKVIENIIDSNIDNSLPLESFINDEIDKVLNGHDLTNLERSHIFNLIDNDLNGYGPINELLNDPNISEIMVNAPNEIYVEIDGKIIRDETISFINDEHILRIIGKMIGPLGKTIDSSNPMVDSRLPDGSRINAIIPPLSINGPVLTIRKFKSNLSSIDDLLRNGTLTRDMAIFLECAVRAKMNMIVCGGTGSGKTTILNILSGFIGDDERIITIEDAAELRLHQNHVISLETRVTNYDTKGEVTMRDLVRNSLRMRPDRIIVGEVRGSEAFDMLQAMNTGHEGSLTTLHANGAVDALNRLETMVLMGNMEIPVGAIRDYIKNAIDIVVTVGRLSDGRRKITSINEITGINENGEIIVKEIFAFKQTGLTLNSEVIGEFRLDNYIPMVYQKIKNRGYDELDFLFQKDVDKKKKGINNKVKNNKVRNNKNN